jgi:hypothetical protein
MEISFQTYRSELNRLSNLSVGFLRSAELDDFEHWEKISKQRWNRIVLTHKQVPREFYTVLLATADDIRNEFIDREPVRDKILSKETDHASLYQIISEHRHIDVSRKQLREYLVPMGLRAILERNPWKNTQGCFEHKGKLISPMDWARSMMNQLLIVLCMEDDGTEPGDDEKIVRINPKVFFGGFEEAIDLAILLAKKEYTQILMVLQTTKTRVGRLKDGDFEPFIPYYEHLAKIFLFHHRFTDTRPGLQRRHYQHLSQLFQTELGYTQSKVKARIESITPLQMKKLNAEYEVPIMEKFLGQSF